MLLNRRGSLVEILCPAKLNLFLEVKGKRADGYHEIESVMQTVSVYDTLSIEPAACGVQIACSDASVPCDERNTVHRAVREVRSASGIDRGVSIRIEKRIPAGAGMAGGSSDAAGAIAGLNELWQLNLPKQKLEEIGAAVGSDVPFFFTAGTAVCRGRGELVMPIEAVCPLTFVVAWPGFGISTKEVYQRLEFDLTVREGSVSISTLVEALVRNDVQSVSLAFYNRLEHVALAMRPELENLRRIMAESGLLGTTMTGSGSAYFGLCERKEVVALRERLAKFGIGTVFACESVQG